MSSFTRPAREPVDQVTYERTVEAILCDLCAVEFEPNNDSIHLPLSNKVLRSKSRYKGTALGKTLPAILDVMSTPEMDFVVLEKGHSTFKIVDDELNVAFAGGTAVHTEGRTKAAVTHRTLWHHKSRHRPCARGGGLNPACT